MVHYQVFVIPLNVLKKQRSTSPSALLIEEGVEGDIPLRLLVKLLERIGDHSLAVELLSYNSFKRHSMSIKVIITEFQGKEWDKTT